jgi:hypothetical protein
MMQAARLGGAACTLADGAGGPLAGNELSKGLGAWRPCSQLASWECGAGAGPAACQAEVCVSR